MVELPVAAPYDERERKRDGDYYVPTRDRDYYVPTRDRDYYVPTKSFTEGSLQLCAVAGMHSIIMWQYFERDYYEA